MAAQDMPPDSVPNNDEVVIDEGHVQVNNEDEVLQVSFSMTLAIVLSNGALSCCQFPRNHLATFMTSPITNFVELTFGQTSKTRTQKKKQQEQCQQEQWKIINDTMFYLNLNNTLRFEKVEDVPDTFPIWWLLFALPYSRLWSFLSFGMSHAFVCKLRDELKFYITETYARNNNIDNDFKILFGLVSRIAFHRGNVNEPFSNEYIHAYEQTIRHFCCGEHHSIVASMDITTVKLISEHIFTFIKDIGIPNINDVYNLLKERLNHES